VRTVAGTPATESADSNELSAATISRPAAPTGVGATAVVFRATTPSSAAVTATVPAAATTTTTLDLSALLEGTITPTPRSRDAAGNRSGTVGPTNVVVKDTAAPPLTADYSSLLGLGPKVSGDSERGATVRATKTSGSNVWAVFSTQITSGSSYSYAVEDLAGDTSTAVTTGG